METIEIFEQCRDQTSTDPGCPICGGALIPLRDYVRCSRCCHSFCVSCEATDRNEEQELF